MRAIISVRPNRPLCGISDWARRIEAGIAGCGFQVNTMGHGEFARKAKSLHGTGLILQLEIAEDSKDGSVLSTIIGLARWRAPKWRKVVILHSVFSPGQLRIAKPLAGLAVAYQWLVYRLLEKLCVLVVLSSDMQAQLAQHHIRSSVISLGAYSNAGDRCAEADMVRPLGARLLIGLVGHPYLAKQYHLAAEAFAMLDSHTRSRARLIVLGGDPASDMAGAAALGEALSKLDPRDYTVTGPIAQEQFNDWISRLDLVLMPYAERGSASAVYAHVLGSCIPSVVSEIQLFRPIVAIGGAIAAKRWPEDATSAMTRLIGHPMYLKNMCHAIRDLALSDSMASVADTILALMTLAR